MMLYWFLVGLDELGGGPVFEMLVNQVGVVQVQEAITASPVKAIVIDLMEAYPCGMKLVDMDAVEDFVEDLGGVLEEWGKIRVSVVYVGHNLLLQLILLRLVEQKSRKARPT